MEKEGLFNHIIRGQRTFGERAADGLASYAGSWTFILGFVVILILWIMANVYMWVNAWDPYPFILLNLVLSCVAALQAPIILMSQNRQAQKDRLKSGYDYRVNVKAEREIENILEKLDSIEKAIKKK
ncbi:MAG: DUF1003 domain-containing protein [archaeon]|nr:DUF1003 domain-containing protein [archaeon]MCR4323447.1 DUF1003 domain-containing protein [Nanoarchaeota archaeon]